MEIPRWRRENDVWTCPHCWQPLSSARPYFPKFRDTFNSSGLTCTALIFPINTAFFLSHVAGNYKFYCDVLKVFILFLLAATSQAGYLSPFALTGWVVLCVPKPVFLASHPVAGSSPPLPTGQQKLFHSGNLSILKFLPSFCCIFLAQIANFCFYRKSLL